LGWRIKILVGFGLASSANPSFTETRDENPTNSKLSSTKANGYSRTRARSKINTQMTMAAGDEDQAPDLK